MPWTVGEVVLDLDFCLPTLDDHKWEQGGLGDHVWDYDRDLLLFFACAEVFLDCIGDIGLELDFLVTELDDLK